ncbi:right-handed parallel beta-helix repeat-containing protein [Halorussus halophilus]|uniref:right-handed parallel beta-helix repeat-containing protein n=1 Tax=Halorussus halophilus TaxID=2650975 RepID=UPI00130150A2|nr:right-handed parallel beta-helix repeat-containing protein [Halorussus halophilus]
MDRRTQGAVILSLLIIVSVAPGVVSTSGTSIQAADPTVLDSCTVVTEPGSYVLDADIETATAGVCIEIRADDVVFDGQNNLLDGLRPPTQAGLTIGIRVTNATNVTVRNVRLAEWDDGIAFDNSSNGVVSGLVAEETGAAISATNSTNVSVGESSLRDGGVAISFDQVRGGEIADVFARNNSISGITLDQSRRVAIRNVTAIANTSFGPMFFRRRPAALGIGISDSRNVTVTGVNVTENIGGVSMTNTTDSEITDCTASRNGFGIRLVRSSDETLDGCTLTENDLGLAVVQSRRVNVTEFTVESNELGIDLFVSENVSVAESTVTDSSRVGLVVERADYNEFRDVTVEGTTAESALDGISAGILLDNATRNEFTNAAVSDNENWAVFAVQGGTNVFEQSVFGTMRFSFRLRNVALDAADAESAPENDPVESVVPLEVAATQPDSVLNVTLREPLGAANETVTSDETETPDSEGDTEAEETTTTESGPDTERETTDTSNG